jgi:hypothetical protein
MEAAHMSRDWRKSSYSGTNGNCVEVAAWRKSNYSGSNGNCVETATIDSVVAVRDSKNPEGPRLAFSPEAWRTFATSLKRGSC